jgi:hypothetical protein
MERAGKNKPLIVFHISVILHKVNNNNNKMTPQLIPVCPKVYTSKTTQLISVVFRIGGRGDYAKSC